MLKYVKCYLKTENCCLKKQTKHPLRLGFSSPFHQTQFTKYISRRLWEKERERSKEGTERERERELECGDKLCLGFVYFVETENFLLKIL